MEERNLGENALEKDLNEVAQEAEALEARLKAAEEELKNFKDRYLRLLASFLRAQSYEDRFAEAYAADFEPPKAPEGAVGEVDFSDPLLKKAAEIVVEEGYGSVSRLQRRLSVGHARAGKLMDALEAMGIVGPARGSKPREVLITKDQLKDFFG